MVKRTVIIFCVLLFIGSSCRKDYNSRIPYVYVDLYFYPNSIDYIPIGTSIVKPGGYRGIVIYRPMTDQFVVYDRCCPYDPDKPHAIINLEPGGVTAIDTVCKSYYILVDGTPYKGPSTYALTQYHIEYNGNILHVFN